MSEITNFPNGLSSFGVPVVPGVEFGKVWGDTLFVDTTNGSDNNTGTDRASAKKTIQAAINAATSGTSTKIFIADGAYTENLTIAKNKIMLIGESLSGVVLTGAADATDVVTVTGNELTLVNMSTRSYDTGSDISLIKTTGDGTRIQWCDFKGGEYQIENSSGDYCFIVGCHFVTPDDTTDGACVLLEDADNCKVLHSTFFIDGATDAIIHHDADNLEVGWCQGVGDDDTGASTNSFVRIAGADATSELMVHDCNATLFGALLSETTTLVAAHGFGTSDLATTATVDSIEVPVIYHGNNANGCTVFFDTTGLA